MAKGVGAVGEGDRVGYLRAPRAEGARGAREGTTTVDGILREIIGFIVWLVANGVYLDAVRRGRRGVHRFLGFWFGLPATFVTLLLVTEGSSPALQPPPDDEEALLEEVRRARALAAGGEGEPAAVGEGPDDSRQIPEEER